METNKDELLGKLRAYYNEQNFDEIISLLNDATLESYNDADLYNWRTTAHNAKSEFDNGLKYANKSLAVDNKNAWAWLERGYAQYQLNKSDEAKESFEKVLSFEPGNSMANNNLGAIAENEGSIDKAAEHYREALRLDDKNDKAFENLERLLSKIAREGNPALLHAHIENNVKNKTEKIEVNFKIRYRPYLLIADQIVRIALLVLYLNHYLSLWLFITINIVLIAGEAMWLDHRKKQNEKTLNESIDKKYQNLQFSYKNDMNAPDWLSGIYFIVGLVFTYWFCYHSTVNHHWYQHIWYLLVSLLGGFMFVLVIVAADTVNVKKNFRELHVTRTITRDPKNPVTENVSNYYQDLFVNLKPSLPPLDTADLNDAKIVEIESEVKTISSRVEAYLLESIFLGGLSFSAFLTVVSSEIIKSNLTDFSGFCLHIKGCMYNLIHSNWSECITVLSNSFVRIDLFILIMILCLASSVFFLLVLTLRIRYMSLVMNMDHLQRSMSAFNAKEEEFLKIEMELKGILDEKFRKRLSLIQKKIDDDIEKATNLLVELSPTVRLMSLCRNIAVILFYFVLVVSGYFFSPAASLVILLIALFVITYRYVETIQKSEKLKNILGMKYIQFNRPE